MRRFTALLGAVLLAYGIGSVAFASTRDEKGIVPQPEDPIFLALDYSNQEDGTTPVRLAWDRLEDEEIIRTVVLARQEGKEYDYGSPSWQSEDILASQATLYMPPGRWYFMLRQYRPAPTSVAFDSNEVSKNVVQAPKGLMLGIEEHGRRDRASSIDTLSLYYDPSIFYLRKYT